MLHFKREPLQRLMSLLEWCICISSCIQNEVGRREIFNEIVNEKQTAAFPKAAQSERMHYGDTLKAIKSKCLIHQRHSHNCRLFYSFAIRFLLSPIRWPQTTPRQSALLRPGPTLHMLRPKHFPLQKKLTLQGTYLTYH